MTRFLSKINGFSVFYGSCLRGTRSISISSPALEKLKTRAEDEELYHIKLPEKAFQAYDIDCPSLDYASI
ncbi:unnamed protein product [Pneumocystis jirovecii]|uniref:Uncharacterized protein n=1 Tax=Pneumocystis jirovecii TaxID=42068 RepID=L0PGM9_PNEJI|nr:unnamed protein product [Pneumocystis jirovecii]